MADQSLHRWLNLTVYEGKGLFGLFAISFVEGGACLGVMLWFAVPYDIRRFKQMKYGRILRGPQLLSPEEFNRKEKGDGIGFKTTELGKMMRIPARKEAQHFQIMGDTGVGKTQLIMQILRQIRERGDSAIVYDPACEYLQRFYDKERGDIVLNPLDERCPYWGPAPTSLTVEEFELIVATLQEPWRTMVQIAQCLGLRVSEIAALQWDDFDFDKNQLLVQRSFVNGRVDDVKTEYSQDYVPLHPSLIEIVLKWSTQAVATEEGWVFANPRTNRPYYPTEIQKRHLRPSGCCVVACPTCGAAPGVWCNQDQKTGNGVRMLLHETRVKNSGKYGGIGWHTFRHTYRSWLDETGAPMKVQQELMRHASIQTTMNVYGQAMSSSKREANGKVVEMVLKPLKASA